MEGQALGVNLHDDGPFLLCWYPNKHWKNGGNDMPTLSHVRELAVGLLHVEDDRGRTILLGEGVGEDVVTRPQGGSGVRVPRDPLIYPAWCW